MWSNNSTPVTAGARFVESLRGDILSPKYAPDTMAPATMAGGMANPFPTPIKATPTVLAVVQELPVESEITAQITQVAGKKTLGLRSSSPSEIKYGTTPAIIQTAMSMPITIKMMIALVPTAIPCSIPFSRADQGAPFERATSAVTIAVKASGICGSFPKTRMVIPMEASRKAIGIRAIQSGGTETGGSL
jgi:hypothetical protein